MAMCTTHGGLVNTKEIMRLADWFNAAPSDLITKDCILVYESDVLPFSILSSMVQVT
jgi:hypothetical protein